MSGIVDSMIQWFENHQKATATKESLMQQTASVKIEIQKQLTSLSDLVTQNNELTHLKNPKTPLDGSILSQNLLNLRSKDPNPNNPNQTTPGFNTNTDSHQRLDYENRIKKDQACKKKNYDIFRKFTDTSINPNPHPLNTTK